MGLSLNIMLFSILTEHKIVSLKDRQKAGLYASWAAPCDIWSFQAIVLLAVHSSSRFELMFLWKQVRVYPKTEEGEEKGIFALLCRKKTPKLYLTSNLWQTSINLAAAGSDCFSTRREQVEEGSVTSLIPCPPVMLPSVFEPYAAPRLGWSRVAFGVKWTIAAQRGSCLACVIRSPVPNGDAIVTLSTGREHVLLVARWVSGVLKSTLPPCSQASSFLLGKGLGTVYFYLGSSKGQDEPCMQTPMLCVYASTQLWPDTGLKLFLSTQLPRLRTAATD